jgi:hypothetical protein
VKVHNVVLNDVLAERIGVSPTLTAIFISCS